MIATRPLATMRQQEILTFIEQFHALRGWMPTVREIGDGVGLSSSSSVQTHLLVLARKGYLVHDSHKARTIRLLNESTWQALQNALADPLATELRRLRTG